MQTTVLALLVLAVAALSLRASDSPEVLASLLGLVPVLIALRYGFVLATIAVTATLATVAVVASASALAILLALMATPFAVALCIGFVRDHHERTRTYLEAMVAHQGHGLEGLSRRYHALRASHAALEAELRQRQLDAMTTGTVASPDPAPSSAHDVAPVARVDTPIAPIPPDQTDRTLYGLPPPLKAIAWLAQTKQRLA